MASQPTAQEIQLHIENQALKGRIAQLEAEVTAVNTKVAADAITIATLQAQLAAFQAREDHLSVYTPDLHRNLQADHDRGRITRVEAKSALKRATGL